VRVAILFTDGVGVGRRDPATNPLARAEWLLSQFDDGSGTRLDGGVRHDLDTTFGVPGRPQSASNQTALFTGLPAPRLIGRHVLGFPTPPLRALLAEHSIARTATARGRSVGFANAFPSAYLAALGLQEAPAHEPPMELPERWRRRLKPSASTLAMAAGGVRFKTFDDLAENRALTPDVDGRMAARRGLSLEPRSAEQAASIFWSIASDLTLFEHFLADEAGHAQDAEAAVSALSTFDAFARAVLATRPEDAHVFVVSDHGNVEDLSTRNHTTNPVAALSFGPGEGRLSKLSTLADVGLAALALLEAA
jgi:hypothetical protein